MIDAFLDSLLLMLCGIFLVYLKLTNALNFFIRPDYHLFTFVMGLFLLGAGVINVGLTFRQSMHAKKNWQLRSLHIFTFLALSALLIFGMVNPRKALSAQSAARRGTNQNLLTGVSSAQTLNAFNALADQNTASPLLHTTNSNNYTIADWIRLFTVNPEPDNYTDKPVNVVGFVQVNPNNTFTVSRFVITCCAVDASPIGLIVDRDPATENLKADDWVQLTGKLAVKEINGNRQAVVEASDIKKIPQPVDPYLY